MKTAIIAEATRLGFDVCRFAPAVVAPPHTEAFTQWLAQGWHANMEYMARNAAQRMNPGLVLSGAKTIIVLAASYFNGVPAKPLSTFEGLVARYARHADYHDVLAPKLESLMRFIQQQASPPLKSLFYTDAGPILERAIASECGVGFAGKHTNLISPKLGNWFFLAEIITTLEIEPDPPLSPRCGSCTRCLNACPTAALRAPHHLDARRCISYLTIELKGSIPVEFRRAIGRRVFGCDSCLDVCPWNRFAREASLMKEFRREDLNVLELLELLSLDNAAFKKRFEGTPMLRSKRRGLLRNACVVLGNIGDSRALPALERAAQDSDAIIAEHAQWAMNAISHPAIG
jgi:epoxyqueuosine reductase